MTEENSPLSKPGVPPPAEQPGQVTQTGALPGLQPGQGVDKHKGQSNVDAATAQGVEYGEHHRRKP